MDRTLVSSSSVRSIGYEPASRTLEVEFLESGAVYLYFGVPREVFEAFLSAESHGTYFNENIKDRYMFQRR